MADLHAIDTKTGFGSHMLVENASSSMPLSPPPSSSSSVSPCSSLSETAMPLSGGRGSGMDGHLHHPYRHPGLLDDIRPLDRAPRQSDQQRPHSITGPISSSSEGMTTSQLLSRRKSASVSEQPQQAGLLARLRPRHTLRPVSNEHARRQDVPMHSIPHHPSFTAELEPLPSLPSSPTDNGEGGHRGAGHPVLDGPNTISNKDISATRKRPLNRAGPPRANPRGSRPIPVLRRYSTNSMINSIRLSTNSDDEIEMEDEDSHHTHHDHDPSHDLDLGLASNHGRPGNNGVHGSRRIKRQSSRVITILRQDGDHERQARQCITPDTDTGAEKAADRALRRTVSKTSCGANPNQRPPKQRRRPLGDISFSTLSDEGGAANASLDDGSLSPPRELKRPRLTEGERTFTSPYFEEYGDNVFQHMIEIEGRHRRCFYSEQHPGITGTTRCVLVDWLIHLGYFILGMQSETIHHGVYLLDRYLIEHEEEVNVNRLQCISVAALLVAGKLVETATRLSTNALSYACSRTFSAQNITDQELDLLKTLKFELTVASVSTFAQYFKQALEIDEDVDYFIDYLCDVSLLSHHFLDFCLSKIAAAAIMLALEAKGRVWTEEMRMLSGYAQQALAPCVEVFLQTLKNIRETIPCTFPGLQEKYPKAELNFL